MFIHQYLAWRADMYTLVYIGVTDTREARGEETKAGAQIHGRNQVPFDEVLRVTPAELGNAWSLEQQVAM